MNNQTVFLDANILVYFLDETADNHQKVVATIQKLLAAGARLYTSQHVIEEVLFIISKLVSDKATVVAAVKQIGQIPGLQFIEPTPDLQFAARYIKLWQKSGLGINDALLLQLMADAGINYLFSYDAKLSKQAAKLKIQPAT